MGTLLLFVVLSYHSAAAPPAGGPVAYISGGTVLINPIASPLSQAPSSTGMPSVASQPIAVVSSPYTAEPSALKPLPAPESPRATAEQPAPQQSSLSASDSLLREAYSLLPTGFTAVPTRTRTPAQQALYEYGNAAGQVVLQFETTHADMTDVLKAWLSARNDSSKETGVESLGDDMKAAGQSLGALSSVPAAAASAHAALAAAFVDAGEKMLAVARAGGGSDTELLSALKAYNASADSFTSAYIALAAVFSLSGVHFSSTDPGSAFEFSGSTGL